MAFVPQGIDVLLGADVLYSAIAWRALAETAKELLSDDGVMIISTTGHANGLRCGLVGGRERERQRAKERGRAGAQKVYVGPDHPSTQPPGPVVRRRRCRGFAQWWSRSGACESSASRSSKVGCHAKVNNRTETAGPAREPREHS